MNIISSLFDTARKITSEVMVKQQSLSIPVSSSILNSAAEKVVTASDGPIRSLKLDFSKNEVKATATIQKIGVSATIETCFDLTKFEISPERQILCLRRTSDLIAEGENWWSNVAIYVLRAIIVGLLGEDLVTRITGTGDAVSINGKKISVDVGQLGGTELLIDAVTQKWLSNNAIAAALIEDVVSKGSAYVQQYVSIVDAECTDEGLLFKVQIQIPQPACC